RLPVSGSAGGHDHSIHGTISSRLRGPLSGNAPSGSTCTRTCESLPLDLVLRLCVLGRLPLHVARTIRPAASERHDVVHHVPRPAVRMPSLAHKVVLRSLAAVLALGARMARVGAGMSRVALRVFRAGVVA